MEKRPGICTTKIKAYNIKDLVAKDGYQPHTYISDYLAIVEGHKGIVTFNKEGVGDICDDVSSTIHIPVVKIAEDGKVHHYMFPQGDVTFTIQEIKDAAEVEEVEIKDFIRMFGSRLEENFKDILNAINEVGLNSVDYYVEII